MFLLLTIVLVSTFEYSRGIVGTYDHFQDDHHRRHDRYNSHGQGRQTKFLNSTLRGRNAIPEDYSMHICGTHSSTQEEIVESTRVVNEWMSKIEQRHQTDIVVVPTYFHVILPNETLTLADAVLLEQIDVLNDAFEPYGFQFDLYISSRTYNIDWFTATVNSEDEIEMKNSLRAGGSNTLNVYINYIGGNLLGHGTFPWRYSGSSTTDGIVLSQESIPGGTYAPKNSGKTLIHEVGHWLGLLHPFETFGCCIRPRSLKWIRQVLACAVNSDLIHDTPKQSSPTYGCPSQKDSCPGIKGLDAIHNYMDYSDDICVYEFTSDQNDRMQAMWYKYRAL